MTKLKEMSRGGKREGAGRPKVPPKKKRQQYWVFLEVGTIAQFEKLAGGRREAQQQIEQWVEEYCTPKNKKSD
jgi:hypothetical protein